MYKHLYTFERVLSLTDELEKLKLENLRLKADFSRAKAINDHLIEENERLEAELTEKRNNHDRLQDFEVAESEDLREAKLYLRILLEHLQETGHDVEKLEKIIALKRCIMKLEETNE